MIQIFVKIAALSSPLQEGVFERLIINDLYASLKLIYEHHKGQI